MSDFDLLEIYADFDDFINNVATEASGTTTLQLDGCSIELVGVTTASLHEDDFIFV